MLIEDERDPGTRRLDADEVRCGSCRAVYGVAEGGCPACRAERRKKHYGAARAANGAACSATELRS